MHIWSFSSTLRIAISVGIWSAAALAQDQAGDKQRELAALREGVAKNRQALRQYMWTETTTLSLKGEQKHRSQKECRYGPDGQLVKTPIGAAPAGGKKRGLRGKIVENKKEEFAEYLERAGSLIRHYVPPDPDRMKSAFESAKASLVRDEAGGSSVVEIRDYYKSADAMTLKFAKGQLSSISVKSYLDDASDAVTLDATFQRLPDGTNYMGDSVMNATSKKIQIHVNNFGHQKASGQ